MYVFDKIHATDSSKFHNPIQSVHFIQLLSIMLALCSILLPSCYAQFMLAEQAQAQPQNKVTMCTTVGTYIYSLCIHIVHVYLATYVVYAYQVAVNIISVTLPDYLNNWIQKLFDNTIMNNSLVLHHVALLWLGQIDSRTSIIRTPTCQVKLKGVQITEFVQLSE